MRRDCESGMLDQMGNASMCEIHKDGRVTGGLKYQEGRLVEFGADILTAAQIKWTQQLERYQVPECPSIPWIAYSQGGVDAIEQIRQATG